MASQEKLFAGFRRFKKQYFGDDSHLYDSMKNGQPAKTLMVACCDSRVDPAILTDCDPGDLFTIRNVANLVPPCEDGGHFHGTSAALEFAVNSLEVENIIVMGHANCGGINALWHDDGSTQSQFINSWVSIAQPAKESVLQALPTATLQKQIKTCEQQAVLVSLENLLTFPCIRKRVEGGSLRLHGWYFDIPAGDLLSYDPATEQFELVSE
jgi:carbonic anhydrase